MPRLAQTIRRWLLIKGPPLSAYKLPRQSPAAEGFLEATEQGLGIGGQRVAGIGDQPRVIINYHAQCVATVLGCSARNGPGEKSTIHRSLTPGASKVLVGPGMFWRSR